MRSRAELPRSRSRSYEWHILQVDWRGLLVTTATESARVSSSQRMIREWQNRRARQAKYWRQLHMTSQAPDKFKAANAFWVGLGKIGLSPAAVLRQARQPVTLYDREKNF